MHWKKTCLFVLLLIVAWTYAAFSADTVEASSCKILVIMSYEENNPWSVEIKEGVESTMPDSCDIKYFYMNTKENFNDGPEKAKEAYNLYKQFKPDGVIAADDNAQSMFVVPYLKDKVKTPVMFCGVNGEPEDFGYPASNVSGILERAHIDATIALAKQLDPSIETVGFIAKSSPSGLALKKQVEKESDTYLAKVSGFKLAKTKQDTLLAVEELGPRSDALFMESTRGILDEDGNPLLSKEIIQLVSNAFGKPVLGANRYHVEEGVLCATIKTGQNQGRVAAEMLLKSMQGTAASKIPIVANKHGKRLVNVSVMKSLGIKPKRRTLIGSELVYTAE